jgi:hypothetical protein
MSVTSLSHLPNAENLCAVLLRAVDQLDLPPYLHDVAEQQYSLVGQFLADHGGGRGWDVYPQGSFRLGTVVRPLAGEFDLDMVCRLDVDKHDISQEQLKQTVGQVLAGYMDAYRGHPGCPYEYQESRRCWTLHYESDFHLDVLPAIPNAKTPPSGILLTDKKLVRWQKSDPIKYADWFHWRKGQEHMRRKAELAAEARKSISEFPDWMVKTTLQRVVQVLKAHRDLFFKDTLDDRPPSVLITTLVGKAYEGSGDLLATLLHVVAKMPDFIEPGIRGPRVMSPVADENFADKWAEYPSRHSAFRTWLARVGSDLAEAADQSTTSRMVARLGAGFGEDRINKAAAAVRQEIKTGYRAVSPVVEALVARGSAQLANRPGAAPQEQYISEKFPVRRSHRVEVTCDVSDPSYPNRAARRQALRSSRGRVAKQKELFFKVVGTDVPPPYDVYWKVRNHGEEAKAANGLRGQLMPDDGTGQRKESTAYTGHHYMIPYGGACCQVAILSNWCSVGSRANDKKRLPGPALFRDLPLVLWPPAALSAWRQVEPRDRAVGLTAGPWNRHSTPVDGEAPTGLLSGY